MVSRDVLLTINVIRSGSELDAYKQTRNIAQLLHEIPTKVNDLLQIQFAFESSSSPAQKIIEEANKQGFQTESLDYAAEDMYKRMLLSTKGRFVIFLKDGFLSPKFLAHALRFVTSSTEGLERRALIPSSLMAYGNHNRLIDLRQEAPQVIAKLLCDGILSATVPFVTEKQKYATGIDSPMQVLGGLINEGVTLLPLEDTQFFYKYSPHLSLANIGSIFNSVLSPKTFSDLVSHTQQNTNSSDDIKTKEARATVKKTAEHFKRNAPAVYGYLRDQYHLNRDYAKKIIRSAARRLNKPQKSTVLIQQAPDTKPSVMQPMPNGWGQLNQIEPMIRPSTDIVSNIELIDSHFSNEGIHRYAKFCNTYKNKIFTDIVMVPHLVEGGADLAALKLVEALTSQGKEVAVIVSLETESPWAYKVNEIKNATLIEAKQWFAGLDEAYRAAFVARIIAQWNVKRLSVINSSLGYQILRDYGPILKKKCMTFLHTYAFDMTEDGFLYNVLHNGLVDAYDGVDKFVTDSAIYKQQLSEVNGFEPDKIEVLYLPVSSKIIPKEDYAIKRKVLWASRINSSKLIEAMVEVGKLLQTQNIELDIYGAIDGYYGEGNRFLNMIKDHKTIHYQGVYDGFASLDTNNYDIFLMTSKNEGMPNVILEACMANIYIVAPSVGGIPECIVNEKNGSIVTAKFDPHDYADRIFLAYKQNSLAQRQTIEKYNKAVIQRHSQQRYEQGVRKLMESSLD